MTDYTLLKDNKPDWIKRTAEPSPLETEGIIATAKMPAGDSNASQNISSNEPDGLVENR
jgi:hypothetical protein